MLDRFEEFIICFFLFALSLSEYDSKILKTF